MWWWWAQGPLARRSRRAFPRIRAAACFFSKPDEIGAPAEAPPEMLSPNPCAIIMEPEMQAAWQWPKLMARRTAVQEPRLYWRGRGVGGSSAMNAQIAIRGVTDAFDEWAAAGCEGWAASDVLPVFSAMEDDEEAPFPDQHGKGGPIPVYRAPVKSWGPVDRAVRDAALDIGYPWHEDLNAADGEGVACYPINNRLGRRVSTNEAYLEPARDRANLTIRGRRACRPRDIRWSRRERGARASARERLGGSARQ